VDDNSPQSATGLDDLTAAQLLRYAEELGQLHAQERRERERAERVLRELASAYDATVSALATAVDVRDVGTGDHAARVTDVALRLASAVAPELAADPEVRHGFVLHDIGKIGVPDAILRKPGPLSPDEILVMREHPLLGERIVAGIPNLAGIATAVIGSHHERWDGAGYPRRLARDEIPLAARVFAIADTFDAMTSDRPYRMALPVEHALEEIWREAGAQFDAELALVFVALMREDAAA
jgi:HD-GYP domain-containing protein (c-di-GMP phosphodiesterase class II)